MQKELAAEGLPVVVEILGVNPEGQQSGNVDICTGRDIPWLQESSADSVSAWAAWAPTYRDVVILGASNEKLSAYNLTTHDLSVAGNYAELAQILRDAAAAAAP